MTDVDSNLFSVKICIVHCNYIVYGIGMRLGEAF